jgi:HD-GYP domain-containing protein (c-di-GMP phosphodiesterase class II)
MKPSEPARTGPAAFQLLVWILAAVSVPDSPAPSSSIESLTLMIATWVGVLGATAFSYLSSSGISVSLVTCFQCLLVMTGFDRASEAAFLIACFLGTMSFSGRIGLGARDGAGLSLRAALTQWAALRIAGFVYAVTIPAGLSGTLPGAAACSVFAIVLLQASALVLRSIGGRGRLLRTEFSFARLMHGVALPVFFMPFLLPAVTGAVGPGAARGDVSLLLPAGVASMITVQVAMALSLERSKWSQGRALSLEKAMAALSRRLVSSKNPAAALQSLAVELQEAIRSRAIRVTWGNLSMALPSGSPLPRGKPLRRTGRAGLQAEIWADPATVLDPARLDAFVLQTEAALQSIELGSSISREAWNCMEAMVQSLDRSDHRLAGHSKRVARLATELGRRLNLQPGLLDSLRMSSLLHHVAQFVLTSRPYEDLPDADSSLSRFALPGEAIEGLTRMRENFDGTGLPDGLAGNIIPIQARILSVSDEFITGVERMGGDAAMTAVSQRSGSLYDPAIVQVLSATLEDGFEA